MKWPLKFQDDTFDKDQKEHAEPIGYLYVP